MVRKSILSCHYVNQIHRKYGVRLIINESSDQNVSKRSFSFVKKFSSIRLASLYAGIKFRLRNILRKDEIIRKERDYRKKVCDILGEDSFEFDKDIDCITVKSINDISVAKILRDENPDVILVKGTSIVKDLTLPNGVFNFNMHSGLSPYYRGASSIRWALINQDPFNIGVTIHSLNEMPDAGDIIVQKRIIPDDQDTISSIAMKITREGTSLALMILKKKYAGSSIKFFKQDLTLGKCYYTSHWSPELTQVIKNIEEVGLKCMLEKPSSYKKETIIEWKEQCQD